MVNSLYKLTVACFTRSAPADCKRVFKAACSERTLKTRPSIPLRYFCFFRTVEIASLSLARAGVFLRNAAFSFFPSAAPLPTISPTFASPAPYPVCSVRFVNPHPLLLEAAHSYL